MLFRIAVVGQIFNDFQLELNVNYELKIVICGIYML